MWKTVKLMLRTNNQPESSREAILWQALSLLCSSINATLHERFFGFKRRCINRKSIPSWLAQPGPAFFKTNYAEKMKFYWDEVKILEAHYSSAHIRFSNGRKPIVSANDLAPNPT